MRINQYIATATGISRRAADRAITNKRVTINGQPAALGQDVASADTVELDNKPVQLSFRLTTILLNKPAGYVCSRDGQGSQTIYDLLPQELHELKPVGRLDKDSSGLLLMTNNGQLTFKLTHPSFKKPKVYNVTLKRPLDNKAIKAIEQGIELDDGPSRLRLQKLDDHDLSWQVSMHEGRNRQVRRTFEAVGNKVIKLHRIEFGDYKLGKTPVGSWIKV